MSEGVGDRAAVWVAVVVLLAAVIVPAGSAHAIGCDLVGAGTPGDPHLVASQAQLVQVGLEGSGSMPCGLGASYLQTDDIVLAGGWTPIGTGTFPFTGTYDGGGRTISGLSVTGLAFNAGLFGSLQGASVTDLTISGTVSTDDQSGRGGGLTGEVDGNAPTLIRDVQADVAVSARFAGGLVGQVSGSGSLTIEGVTASGSVTADQLADNRSVEAGGLVGTAQGSGLLSITDSSASGDVVGRGSGVEAGGLIGMSSSDRRLVVRDSNASGRIEAESPGFTYVGGLIGRIERPGILEITDSEATGNLDVEGATSGGRLHAGGLVGYINRPAQEATLRSVVATGEVVASSTRFTYAGGLVGLIDVDGSPVQIEEASATGAVTANGDLGAWGGGLVGRSSGGGITCSSARGDVEVVSSGDNAVAGGLAGEIGGGTQVRQSFAIGMASATTQSTLSAYAGGLLGFLTGSTLTDVYARGDASATSASLAGPDSGGLFGGASSSTVVRAFATGAPSVQPGDGNGGVGGERASSTVTASFWDLETSTVPNAFGVRADSQVGAQGASTTQMTTLATFADAGWSIVVGTERPNAEVWGIPDPGGKRGYPFLLWEDDANGCLLSGGGGGNGSGGGSVGGGGGGGAPQPPGDDPAPVPVDPGEADGTVDGAPIALDVADDGGARTVSGGGVSVGVGQPGTPPVHGEPVLTRGSGVEVAGEGLEPGSTVRVWLLLDGVELGVFEVGEDGRLAGISAPVPGQVAACPQVLVIAGTRAGGGRVQLTVGMWVADAQPRFADVPTGATHGLAVACLADREVIRGVGAGRFAPAGSLQRGQAASLLARALGLSASGGSSGLSDVEGTTHAAAIEALVEAGLLTGFEDGTFRPLQVVTRGQWASMLAALLELEPEEPRFPDAAGVHGGAIGALTRVGVLRGFPDGSFRPGDPLGRAQSASMLERALRLQAAAAASDEGGDDEQDAGS